MLFCIVTSLIYLFSFFVELLEQHRGKRRLLTVKLNTNWFSFLWGDLHMLNTYSLSCSFRIPSSTDGWMEYVPISEKKKVRAVAQLREGKRRQESGHSRRDLCLWLCSLVCEGGPLLYDGVQLVQNSAALNGTQRVLLDQVITREECSALKHLAHVRPSHSRVFGVSILFVTSKCVVSPVRLSP